MTTLLRFPRLLGAIAFFLCTFSYAAPQPDTTFGTNGEVRLGVPTGFEDETYASALQGDGKLLVAGTSTGHVVTPAATTH